MLIQIEKQKHFYKGIGYYLILVGEKGQKYKSKEEINPNLWWVVEYANKKLSENGFFGDYPNRAFLWYDTKGMTEYRIKDKYHQCDLEAMRMIDFLLGGNFFSRIRLILREAKKFIVCERIIFFKRLWYLGQKFGIRKERN